MRHLFLRPGGTRASTTQSGKDPLSMAASLADMPVGSWVAITMRAPHRSLVRHEDRAWDRWIKGRIVGGTHHSLEPNGVIAHVAAASTSRSSVDSLLRDRKSTRLNSSHVAISYAVFCLKKKRIE